MSKLIDRRQAEQAVEAYLCSQCDRNGDKVCHMCPHLDGDEIMKSVPTIEAKPVRHGHWIKYVQFYDTVCKEVPMVECSDCRYITTQENLHNVSENGKELPDFCPCCGADMREDLKYRESG